MTSITNPPASPSRRRRFTRAPLAHELALTARDLAIFSDILSYGGVLETGQISLLRWPPAIAARLRYWKLAEADVERLKGRYSGAYLNEKIELLKFLRKVRRLLAGPKRLTAEYRRLQEWLLALAESQPESWHLLKSLLAELEATAAASWLLSAIEQDVHLPVSSLPVLPSELVSSACIKRLRLLYDAGWLDKDEPLTKLGQGRGQTLWYLTPKTRRQLAKIRGVPAKEIPWKAVGAFGQLHLPHRLAINDFRIAATIAAERYGFVIRSWLDEDDLRRMMGQQPLTLLADPTDPDSKTIKRRLVPDSFFWLETDKNWFHFLEIDRGTETLQYRDSSRDLQFWGLKVRKYAAYFKDYYRPSFAEAKGRGRILVVTTSDTRLVNMAQVCCELAAKAARRYWLTTFDKIKPQLTDYFSETILTAAIWQRADQLQDLRPLIW
ncbi:MAG: hypothetical protein FOGNACKC_02874 [Anaerolineae bacterium]|nr:hypothetical protein [Anaerolineae bacterium]